MSARLEALVLALGERKLMQLVRAGARDPKVRLTAAERRIAAGKLSVTVEARH